MGDITLVKKSSINDFFKLGLARPNKLASAGSAVKYAAKYGLVGLRHRIRTEIYANRAEDFVPDDDPSSKHGSISFSILMPTYNVDIKWLSKAVESVYAQSYDNWELCIVDDCSDSSELRSYLSSIQDDRVHVSFLEANGGISAASNAAASQAKGDYLVLLDNDDELKSNALFELYLRITASHADIVYSDHEVIDGEGNRLSTLFKPDWSPDLMLCQMYMGHLIAFKRFLFNEVGGFRKAYDGSQDYDLLLRMMLRDPAVEHVSKVLYSWRSLPSSTATNASAKPYAQAAGLRAIQDYLDAYSSYREARVEESDNLFVYDVRYPIPDSVKASIIIPTKDHCDDLETIISSVIALTDYTNYEIIVVNNNSELPESESYFRQLPDRDSRIKVIDDPIPFNWSKLNNDAVATASGDVFVFLNNDTQIISTDWLTRLVENALRDEIGVVGALLLYPDGTIQHDGVVIGMGGWADHVYKGCKPVHYGNPYISPLVTRNVSAVTGACMAISKEHYQSLGGFDEDFIVCGSDVELCLHAMKLGLRNIVVPWVKLKHFESKTRDAKDIPEIDFKLSDSMYAPFRRSGDPYYNSNLDYGQCVPTVLTKRMKLDQRIEENISVTLEEVRPLKFSDDDFSGPRLTLFLPSVNPEDVYGGISTAVKFFHELADGMGCAARIVTLDSSPRFGELGPQFAGYEEVKLGVPSSKTRQIVSAFDRECNSLPWAKNDIALCTCWWSAYLVQSEASARLADGRGFNPLVYLIQDYEPGFYAWSSQYLLSESTYKSDVPTIAVFNSSELKDYFIKNEYHFVRSYYFNPMLNGVLAGHLRKLEGKAGKRRQVLVYGRPGTPRNAFSLVVEMLREWIEFDDASIQWDFISAGEEHPAVLLAKGRYLTSVGKLTLDEYARVLSESAIGISLMVSPHPSYPPLEMAAFGAKVITNGYQNKNLSISFSDNIYSLDPFTIREASKLLTKLSAEYSSEVPVGEVPPEYVSPTEPFPFLDELVSFLTDL